MRRMRYEYILDVIDILKPESIIEIGVAKGVNAVKMVQKAGFNVEYTGYDVFDYSDKEWHHMVGNGKESKPVEHIRKMVEPLCSETTLVKGMTQDTLWSNPKEADLVFLDGDHRVDAIQGDFDAVKNSKVVIFDDYYIDGKHSDYEIDKFGCNQVVEKLGDFAVTPLTQKVGHVRLAVWCNPDHIDEETKQKIEKAVTQ